MKVTKIFRETKTKRFGTVHRIDPKTDVSYCKMVEPGEENCHEGLLEGATTTDCGVCDQAWRATLPKVQAPLKYKAPHTGVALYTARWTDGTKKYIRRHTETGETFDSAEEAILYAESKVAEVEVSE